MVKNLDPIHLGHLIADLARRDYADQVRDKAEFLDEAILPATYNEFDAESGSHSVETLGDSIEPAVRAETNGGLRKGDPVEFIYGVIDAMPRPYEPNPKREVKRSPTPKFAALIAKKALVRIRTYYEGGSAEIIKPAQAATVGVVYYDANRPPKGDWVGTSEQPRYTFGIDRIWSGLPPTENKLYYRNREVYCWKNKGDWQEAPRNLVRSSGYNYERQFGVSNLHYEFLVRSNLTPSGYDVGGGVIIIHRQPASAPVPDVPLPKVYWKILNPEFPEADLQRGLTSVLETGGERWLGCDFSGGNPFGGISGGDALTALYYNWQLLEVFPYSDAVPETVIREEQPPGVIQIAEYEQQYWVFTDSDPPKKLDFATAIQLDPFISLPEGVLVYSDSSIAVDDRGEIHVSIKAVQAGNATNGLIKYYVDGVEVEEPVNWRASWQDDFQRNEDVPNSCHRDYQDYEGINLNDDGDRLFQISKEDLTADDLLEGVEFDLWAYDIITDTTPPTLENMPVCEVELNRAPDVTEPITIPAVNPEFFTLTESGLHKETATLLTYAAQYLE